MEGWQKEHIRKNVVELIKSTNCHVDFIARLTARSVLSPADVDVLDVPSLTQYQKTKKLFDILESRVGAYDHLLKSLEETKQSGAAKILKEHDVVFRCFGTISYDKNHVLGTGSTGTKVFKGKFAGREVAVKVLNTDVVDLELAVREANMMKNLDGHENIIRYYMTESQDNFIYIALEICVISLHDEVKLNWENMDKVEILRQCTKGLVHLHRNRVIHGDLKPVNIMLNQDKQVKLSDFGISKQIQTGRTSVSTARVGTLDWMAPEILQPLQEGDDSVDTLKMSVSADVFSLGCVFHFTFTRGIHPFGGNLFQRQNNIFQGLAKINEDIEGKWKGVISKMISSAPKNRPSAENVLSTFSDCSNFELNTKIPPLKPKQAGNLVQSRLPPVHNPIPTNMNPYAPNTRFDPNPFTYPTNRGYGMSNFNTNPFQVQPSNSSSILGNGAQRRSAARDRKYIIKTENGLFQM